MAPPSVRALHRYSYADYLAHEEASNVKHEFLDGEIYAMAGGTPEHAAMAAAVTVAIGSTLRGGPCRIFSSDLRVRVRATGLATYPDVTVVCGAIETDPADRMTVVNPAVVVEVLSDGTEDYDQGEKLDGYKTIPSLREILIVAHREQKLDLWRREGTAWSLSSAGPGQAVVVSSLGCSLRVDDVYPRVPG